LYETTREQEKEIERLNEQVESLKGNAPEVLAALRKAEKAFGELIRVLQDTIKVMQDRFGV
jgi:CHASE3 domain sensor protein